ncbi:MAG: NADH-quinone oxidoreductase subunit C [Candidatus Obscuribacterales bacterium]|nr:NADH-quinone oxidoreductase subunit C [Candidatus Obscuribacterales bacterium]
MKLERHDIPPDDLKEKLHVSLNNRDKRLGLITSIDGKQIITVILCLTDGSADIWTTTINGNFPAVSSVVPQAHWFERELRDLFGIRSHGHPRMKSIFTKHAFQVDTTPLKSIGADDTKAIEERDFSFLHVEGEDVYELPVGPVHAGIIEPGHFRLSCLGEIVQNLELRLGFLHRGIEKRMTETHWSKTRFVAEAAASDTAVGNALANAIAIESLHNIEIPVRANNLRTMALEIERLAMHIADVGGMSVDLGFSGVSAGLSRLRGTALAIAELLSGSRFMRGFVCPGGVTSNPDKYLSKIEKVSRSLQAELDEFLYLFIDNTSVQERLSGTGTVSKSLAEDFGFVGVAARASGIAYDARQCFKHGDYPRTAPAVQTDHTGDALARIRVRIGEISTSFEVLYSTLGSISEGETKIELPWTLPKEKIGMAVVEAFRGELIHLIVTGKDGEIERYAIKDPSINNWTGMAIAARRELIADFPVCNKSFSLSYSGHDL